MNPDFRDLLRALSDAGARFLVVGAYAVSFHSEPRATADLDVWTDPLPDNAARVYRALASFGAPLNELSEADLCSPDVVFQIGVPPRRIDIMTSITGVAFDEAWAARTSAMYGDVEFPVIGLDALMKNKDLDLLRRHRRKA